MFAVFDFFDSLPSVYLALLYSIFERLMMSFRNVYSIEVLAQKGGELNRDILRPSLLLFELVGDSFQRILLWRYGLSSGNYW